MTSVQNVNEILEPFRNWTPSLKEFNNIWEPTLAKHFANKLEEQGGSVSKFYNCLTEPNQECLLRYLHPGTAHSLLGSSIHDMAGVVRGYTTSVWTYLSFPEYAEKIENVPYHSLRGEEHNSMRQRWELSQSCPITYWLSMPTSYTTQLFEFILTNQKKYQRVY
jgi:hypothetical protein